MQRALNSISHLVRNEGFINGEWVGGGRHFEVINPANQERVAQVAGLGQAEARAAISAAERAQGLWAGKSGYERGKVLRRWLDTVREHRNALGTLIALEAGKPLQEALGEVDYGASFLEWYSEEARRGYGTLIPAPTPDRQLQVLKEPIGPCAFITAWNFPLMLVLRKAAAALAAGCAVVVKPSEEAPLSALALAELGQQAGVPPGAFNVVPADGEGRAEVGEEFCSNGAVRAISFTGSCAVGKHLYRMSAGTVKRALLELGGNAPFIVFPSADMDTTLRAISVAKFRYAGQTCIAANRVLVHASRMAEFCERSKQLIEGMRVGDPLEDGVQLGPLINQSAVEKVERHVSDALSKGAELLTGGGRGTGRGYFFAPTLLRGLREDMACWKEETFGPAMFVSEFSSEEEAVQRANAVPEGLTAYMMSSDQRQIHRVSSRLEYGIVGVNEGLISSAVIPFGGVKESGMGREGGPGGMEEYMETKYVCLGGLN